MWDNKLSLLFKWIKAEFSVTCWKHSCLMPAKYKSFFLTFKIFHLMSVSSPIYILFQYTSPLSQTGRLKSLWGYILWFPMSISLYRLLLIPETLSVHLCSRPQGPLISEAISSERFPDSWNKSHPSLFRIHVAIMRS